MSTESLAHLVRDPETRVGRALLLLDERGDEIEKVAPYTYLVPSRSSTDRVYRVHYGEGPEWCTCPDFEHHGDEEPCKHLLAIGILFAKRRARRSMGTQVVA